MYKRKCIKCLNEFYGYKNNKYCPICKPLILKEYNREYYNKLNPLKKKEIIKKSFDYRKEWRKNNKEKIKVWNEKNKEKLKEYHKQYNKLRQRRLYELYPSLMKKKRRERFYRDYYNLSIEEVNEFKKDGCAICGYNKVLEMISLHHKDKNKKNNNKNNLIPLCYSCHSAIHKGYLTLS